MVVWVGQTVTSVVVEIIGPVRDPSLHSNVTGTGGPFGVKRHASDVLSKLVELIGVKSVVHAPPSLPGATLNGGLAPPPLIPITPAPPTWFVQGVRLVTKTSIIFEISYITIRYSWKPTFWLQLNRPISLKLATNLLQG